MSKNKFSNFDSDFDAFKFNTVKPTKTSVAAAFGDPFGDTKNNNFNSNNGNSYSKSTSNGNNSTNIFHAAFDDDDFNDNFANMKLDGAHGFTDKTDNATKSHTVGAKSKRGFVAKQKLEADFAKATISNQDFAQDDSFGEVLAQVLERSKYEK